MFGNGLEQPQQKAENERKMADDVLRKANEEIAMQKAVVEIAQSAQLLESRRPAEALAQAQSEHARIQQLQQ